MHGQLFGNQNLKKKLMLSLATALRLQVKQFGSHLKSELVYKLLLFRIRILLRLRFLLNSSHLSNPCASVDKLAGARDNTDSLELNVYFNSVKKQYYEKVGDLDAADRRQARVFVINSQFLSAIQQTPPRSSPYPIIILLRDRPMFSFQI